MDVQALYALRDVAGVPTHPVVFLILGVVTWALHIAAVQVMMGASVLTLWGALSQDAQRRRLAQSMLPVSKFMLSLAVFLGVAPLLFVQVIYDPFWYTSNVLSAWWVIGFIVILTIAALLNMFFYNKNHDMGKTTKTVCPGSMLMSIALLLVVGFIMHVLTYQMLMPEQWMSWYAPNGQIDASGQTLHAYSLPRFLFFISLSAPVIGAVLVGYQRYYRPRLGDDSANMTAEYLDWIGRIGMNLITFGGVVSVVLGAWWMLSLPDNMTFFAGSIWMWVGLVSMLLFVAFAQWVRGKMNTGWAYTVLPVGALLLIILAAAKEAMRWGVLYGVHGYDAMDYAINMDWYSTIMFFMTFLIIGGLVMAYIILVAWHAGQTKGVYVATEGITKLGRYAVWSIVLFMVQFFGIGLYVWMR